LENYCEWLFSSSFRALRESEERLKGIFEGASDGILGADLKTQRLVYANPRCCELIGYPIEELLKLGVTNIHPKKDLPFVLDQFRKQAKGKITLARDMSTLRLKPDLISSELRTLI